MTKRVMWLPAVLLLHACSNADVYLMHREFVTADLGEEIYVGGSCRLINVEEGASSSGTAGPRLFPYALRYEPREGGVELFVLSDAGEVIEKKIYEEEFLLSHQKDNLKVSVSSSIVVRVQTWGGARCESPPESEFSASDDS